MTAEKILRLAASLLDLASDRFSYDICSDWEFPEDWTVEDRQRALKIYHEWNGDPEEYDPEWCQFQNWVAMAWASHVLRAMADEANRTSPVVYIGAMISAAREIVAVADRNKESLRREKRQTPGAPTGESGPIPPLG